MTRRLTSCVCRCQTSSCDSNSDIYHLLSVSSCVRTPIGIFYTPTLSSPSPLLPSPPSTSATKPNSDDLSPHPAPYHHPNLFPPPATSSSCPQPSTSPLPPPFHAQPRYLVATSLVASLSLSLPQPSAAQPSAPAAIADTACRPSLTAPFSLLYQTHLSVALALPSTLLAAHDQPKPSPLRHLITEPHVALLRHCRLDPRRCSSLSSIITTVQTRLAPQPSPMLPFISTNQSTVCYTHCRITNNKQ